MSPSSRFVAAASALLFAATASGQSATNLDTQLCGDSQAWADSIGQYIFNNNAWGNDGSGASCTYVYGDGASFDAVWSWSKNGNNTHGYPNAQINTLLFPLAMQEFESMNLGASWNMSPTDGITRANVVYDMFLDQDKNKSNDTVKAKYEIMIWIGYYGNPWPLGASTDPFTGVKNDSLPSVVVGDVTFQLYSGDNEKGQTVHSWLSLDITKDFSADVTPLVTYLQKNAYIENDTYMGILQFGSEVWTSSSNVTFNVSSFNINVTSTNATANKAAAAALTNSSGSSSGSGSGSGSGSSGSGSGSSGNGSSAGTIISLPIWIWEVAAAAGLFALL